MKRNISALTDIELEEIATNGAESQERHDAAVFELERRAGEPNERTRWTLDNHGRRYYEVVRD